MADARFEQLNHLPCGSRALYTMTLLVLGVGYLFAMIQVFEVHAGRDGKPGLSTTDLVIAYSGSHADTRLEAALKGPMKDMLPTLVSMYQMWFYTDPKDSESID